MTNSTKRVVYFLHGLLSSAHYHFAPQLEAWKNELTLVPIDLPGHGNCQVNAGPSYFDLALRYSTGVINRFGRGDIIAASMLGGPVAVRCARARPDLVSRLVLAGFVPDVPQDAFLLWLEGFRRLADENIKLAEWYEQVHGRRWKETLEYFIEDVERRYPEDIRVTSQMLSDLQAPVLITNGSLKSNERNAALHADALGHRVCGRVIEGAGHIPSRDCPEEFNVAVEAFWRKTAVVSDFAVQR